MLGKVATKSEGVVESRKLKRGCPTDRHLTTFPDVAAYVMYTSWVMFGLLWFANHGIKSRFPIGYYSGAYTCVQRGFPRSTMFYRSK